MKDIKRRIKSVGSTMQITKAMELVASSKLRKAKAHAESCRPYFEKQYELMSEIASAKRDFSTVFTESREVKNRLFIVIAGDRGLAGGYNSGVLKLAVQAHEVRLFYTTFVSPLVQNPVDMPILPLVAEGGRTDNDLINYDPSPEAVYNRLVPKFMLSLIYCAIVDAYASENAARRTAMENATDNAEQMIDDLSLKYNRARQEKITNEITEIVSGANALE